jgi:hypothetical protein
MSDDTTQPGITNSDRTDITDNSLITDISQIVSSVVGKQRIERKRRKIRDELVRDYITSQQHAAPSLATQVISLFKRN